MSTEDPWNRLVAYVVRNGNIRGPDTERRREEKTRYRKGYEVRLVLASAEEVSEVRGLLKDVGLTPGRSFEKGRQTVVPVYGRLFFDEISARLPPPESDRTGADAATKHRPVGERDEAHKIPRR